MSKVTRRDVILVAGTVLALSAAWLGYRLATRTIDSPPPPGEEQAVGPLYHCPMHPRMQSDKPGACSVCGMALVPNERNQPRSQAADQGTRIVYRSTMHPGETSDRPGKDSMGMEMVPVEAGERGAFADSGVEGLAAVQVSAQKRQLIGVRTALVERRPLERTIRTVGRVAYDETRLHHVHTKIDGWIERLHANATGELVTKGSPLLTIYSPELLASTQEYLLAVRARERLADATLPGIRESSDELVESARRRLLLFDVTESQIMELEATGAAPRTMTLYAPTTGHVIARNVAHGEKIASGSTLLEIADLTRVWVLADIYEYELPFVHEGQAARMMLSYLPGRAFEGRITLVYPVLSETTRTVKVRLEFPNHDLTLKPEMFGEVEIHSDIGERLVAPESAVIGSGTRDIVFVDRGNGYFEPREVRIGLRLPQSVEILEGLAEGERVVVSGNFLIDSESKLKAALSAAGPPGSMESEGKAGSGHDH